MKDEEAASVISPEMSPVDAAIEEIIEKEKEFEAPYSHEDSAKTTKAANDRKTKEKMRQESLETFAETWKKAENTMSDGDDSDAPKVRKSRRSGSDWHDCIS